MSLQTTVLCFFSVLAAFCRGLEFGERGFDFVQAEYARAITEYHAVNKTVMHIRAVGCEGPVKYNIAQPDTPFKIDEKGHVWLVKRLNYDQARSYLLNVTAEAGNGKCVAHTKIHFEILNMNKHAPQFEFENYSCDIIENTREMRFNPPMRILDSDSGEAGKIYNVTIVETGLPFVFTVDDKGNVKGRATKNMDAEDITDYFFDIIAWDNGKPSKSSFPISLECEVDDVNEFGPHFTPDTYQAKIARGKTYSNITQVFAEDKDIGIISGRVCKYVIEGFNLPFKVSDDGVISIDQPLGRDAYDLYEFQVDAVDCGGQMSKSSAKVAISVVTLEPPCDEEFVGPAKQELTLQQCTGKVYVTPDITLNKCARKQKKGKFSANVSLVTKAGMGCDRETFEGSDMFTICGASNFIDLLPKPGVGREWTEDIAKKTAKDELGFSFNGKTYVEIPEDVLPDDIGDKFTISTWIKVAKSKGRQTIVANTDKERLDRVHFSLSTYGSRLIFVHRREAIHAERDVYCNAEFQYKPAIFDNKWHHILVVADGCATKMYVDGEHYAAVVTEADRTLHNSNLKNKVTVGARYLAKEGVYTNRFTGYLSGLAIRPKTTLDEQVLRCVVGCKEHVNVDGPLPPKFSAKTIDFGSIAISGEGSPSDFIKTLQSLVYINERMVPTPGKRSVIIEAKFNEKSLATVSVDITVAGNTRPVIIVEGLDADIGLNWEKRKVVKEKGLRVFDSLEINYDACPRDEEDSPIDKVRFLDEAVVKVNPAFKKGESFNFPTGIKGLKEKGLTVSFNNEELVIRGIAHFSEYEDVLRQMVYVNLDPDDMMHLEITVTLSTLKGKCKSDAERRNINTIHTNRGFKKSDIKFAQNSQKAEMMPGIVSVEAAMGKTSSSGLSSGVMAAIIICSVAVFAFLLVLGIFKYRQRPETVKVVPPGDDKEEMYWDDTGLSGVRITLNPLQKFQELDLNEDGNNTEKSDTEDEEGTATKGLLEWDNSDM